MHTFLVGHDGQQLGQRSMIAVISTSDQPCWLAEACTVLLLQ